MSMVLRHTLKLVLIGLAWAAPGNVLGEEPSVGRRLVKLLRRGDTRPEASPRNRSTDAPRSPSASGDAQQPDSRAADVILVAAPELTDAGGTLFGLHASTQTDAEIDRFEQLAIANNPTLAQAQSRVTAAIGRQIQAGLYPNPTVGYVAEEIGAEGRAGMQGIMFGQEFPRGGKLEFAATVASHEREQAEAETEAQVWRLKNSVRQLYFETLAAQTVRQLAAELTAIAEKGVEVATQREREGEGTLAETLQAQIELEQVRILADRSSNNHRAAWKRLAAVAGQPELAPETLKGELRAASAERDEAQTLAGVTAAHPELRVAEATVRRADAALSRARVEPIPNVMIEAGALYDFGIEDPIATVGVSLPIPIWNRNQGNIMAAESELVRARREIDRVKLSLADRFAAAWGRYRNALAQVERYGQRLSDDEARRILNLKGEERQKALDAHPQIVPRAQLALVLATEGWQRGEFSYVQVLTAQRTLTQVTLAYVRSLADLRRALTAIDGYLLTDGIGASMAGSASAGYGTMDESAE